MPQRITLNFQVWWGGPADAFIAAKDEGLLEQYESPTAAAIPADLKDPDNYWTGVYVGALGFCSNNEILAELGVDVPASWQIYSTRHWKPMWRWRTQRPLAQHSLPSGQS
ncbi:MAG: ABC transporter substrate-binding protein [Anaerolineaceae bacterium]|nr:ABC transporter substrate-binding protein [Anaerolineaceae bacterium]